WRLDMRPGEHSQLADDAVADCDENGQRARGLKRQISHRRPPVGRRPDLEPGPQGAVRAPEKIDQGYGIEVEHLRPGQLALEDSIEAQDLAIESVPGTADTALPPQHHDFVLARRHDARVHAPLDFCRLQWAPHLPPRRAATRESAPRSAIG